MLKQFTKGKGKAAVSCHLSHSVTNNSNNSYDLSDLV